MWFKAMLAWLRVNIPVAHCRIYIQISLSLRYIISFWIYLDESTIFVSRTEYNISSKHQLSTYVQNAIHPRWNLCVSSFSAPSARQNISSSTSSQTEINSNATVTNLLFSVAPQNTSENSASLFWSISKKNTVWFVICQNTISLINQVRHLSHSQPSGVRREKKNDFASE